ncbi:SigE family RNA polymerase sigma factor [Nocardioides speluncae]|uniref:SigE family RNA polymerase sigma factor n=1 Tax=Nocardioides speluncae TaxID=2670337 RepID=UPI000D69CD0A|nr:SigE family RNA polymerase sigma factor [Nocardioides speluncae]
MGRDHRDDFTGFVAARQTQLRRIAYGLTGSWPAADDLVQTALARLYVAWPKVRRKGAEDAYVRKIMVREAIDESRRPWRRVSVGLEGFDHPAPSQGDPADWHDLIRALGELPGRQRAAVVLRHWIGLSVAETADVLGVSEGTVKSHTSRALERLHTLLAPEGTTR